MTFKRAALFSSAVFTMGALVLAPMAALAQPVVAYQATDGITGAQIAQPVAAATPLPTYCVVFGGSSCGGGGGGGSAYTAAAAPFSVTVGVNKPGGLDSANSAQFYEPVVPGTTTTIDLSKPSGVLGADGATITSAANAFPVSLPTGFATSALQSSIITALGSPFQAGANVGNTSFISTGTAASGAALSGNPVREGCAFNTTLPTVTTGQTVDAQCDARGGGFVTQEQAGVAQTWGNITATATISNLGTVSVPVEQSILRYYDGTANAYQAAYNARTVTNDGNNLPSVGTIPTSAAPMGIAPVVSGSLESCHVLKASPGNLYSLAVTIQATSGVEMILNLTAAPSAGAVTPIWSQAVISNATFGSGAWTFPVPIRGSVGLVACFSSATTPFTYTSSATAMHSAGVE